MIEIYEKRQKALERIRAEGDRLMQAQWAEFYSDLPLKDVDQLINGRHPHGHTVIESQSPESYAATIAWRKKTAEAGNGVSIPSVNLRTLDVGGDIHNDDWRSRTRD